MPKQFGWIHEIACPSENELWVAELLNWRVQKLVLKPTAAGTTLVEQAHKDIATKNTKKHKKET